MRPIVSYSQDQQGADQPSTADKIINFPSKLFGKIQNKTASLDQQLTKQTEKYLQKLAKREARLKKKLYKIDSTAANQLFSTSVLQQYASLSQKIGQDTGGRAVNGPDAGNAKVTDQNGNYIPLGQRKI